MYEMEQGGSGNAAAPITGSGTIRKNPSTQKKTLVQEDGTEVTLEQFTAIAKAANDFKLENEVLKMQNAYLTQLIKKTSSVQYVAKDAVEQHPEDGAAALQSIKRFVDAIGEELELMVKSAEEKKPDEERTERISTLKRENERLGRAYDKAMAGKKEYKKELRMTKKIAKEALNRVAELEQELREEKSSAKSTMTDLKVEIHTLKKQLEDAGDASAAAAAAAHSHKAESGSVSSSAAVASVAVQEGRSRSDSLSAASSTAAAAAMSGISQVDETREIEGGVGQKVVQMKEKKAAKNKGVMAGRFDTMRNLDGEVIKTETGLTVINTNKKVEKIVSHEMNVAKLTVVEGRNLSPAKPAKSGLELWFKLEMGSATFMSAPLTLEMGAPAKWGLDYAYVISTGLQSKPTLPITVYYRRLNKNGQPAEGDGKEMGQAIIPLTMFLPLIGTSESVSQWLPVTDRETKEVRGIVQVVLRVESNVSRSERMLPKEEGFSKSVIKENITATLARAGKAMAEAAPVAEVVNLDPLQQAASVSNPNVEDLIKRIEQGAAVDPQWKNFRKQTWLHFAAMAGKEAVLRKLIEGASGDLKIVDVTDKAGFSPFMYAVACGHAACVQTIRLVKGVNTNRVDWNGNTPLHLAAMHGHSHLIEILVRECGCNLDEQDENGATPLHHAAIMGHKEAVVTLCTLGAMINAEDRDGNSPLLLSLMFNHVDVARYLKDDKKADISAFNSRGDTCLWATIQNHNEEMMNVLLKDQRTDLSRKLGHYDFTLLMRCLLQLDHALCDKIVGVILSHRPDVNITNKLGQTALYFAVAMDRPNMVTFLVAACGALVKVKDKSGNTPLHFCSNPDICKTLIANGAQVNLPNVQGNTPLHCAFAFGGPAVADVMLSAGGDMTRKNNNGLTPADCVLVDQKYIALPYYEDDSMYEHSIFIGKALKK